jgi:hypothetical protein
MPDITFAASANSDDVSELSRIVLRAVMAAAGVTSVVISSTARSPFNQARVMFNNIKSTSVAQQKKLYAAAGDAVIDVFVSAQKDGKTRDQTIALMEAKINALGPANVSHHCADPKKVNVFDVAPSSIPAGKKKAFEAAIRANKSIARFFFPPLDPGYHFEIKQPQA